MNEKETAVYELISAGKVTQRQIALSAKWLGCHRHELESIPKRKQHESTLREVRQVIRDLRMDHGIKILSDSKGYWICNSAEEAQEYLTRMERMAKAQARSWMQTYFRMKGLFNVTSDYFETQQKLEL